MTVKEVYDALQTVAPFETQLDFDNAGLLIGSFHQPVTGIGVVLDVTPQAIGQAQQRGLDCIVSHHPIIFSGLKAIPTESPVYQAIRAGLAVISAHTNLDAAAGGVNDALAAALGLEAVQPLGLPGDRTPPMGRIGRLSAGMDSYGFAAYVSEKLHTRAKYVPADRPIDTVAVCGGAGEAFIQPAAAAGADALVTADVKHHNLLLARSLGLMVVDAGHFETEQVVIAPLAARLAEATHLPVEVLEQLSPVNYC